MSTQVITRPEVTPVPLAARLGDYAQLSRPKIGVMVLVTAWLGMLLAGVAVEPAAVVMMLAGTALVTTGASAFNQLAERRTDARMRRTENRPLPAGRLSVTEVFAFSTLATVGGSHHEVPARIHDGVGRAQFQRCVTDEVDERRNRATEPSQDVVQQIDNKLTNGIHLILTFVFLISHVRRHSPFTRPA